MKKILVHIISQLGELKHDKFREEIYRELSTVVRIYSNTKDLDFSNIRYWKVMDDLKESIKWTQNQNSEIWTYWGDFDKNGCREMLDKSLASCICDKLNSVIGKKEFEVFELRPYKETQGLDSHQIIYYYAPANSECCYDVTDIFLNYPSIDERYNSFLKRYAQHCSIIVSWSPIEYKTFNYPLSEELELEKQIFRLSFQLGALEKELKMLQKECNVRNLRIEAFCSFIVPYIEAKFPSVNDVVEMFPSSCSLVSSISFKEEGCPSYQSRFYPLNIAFELKDKELRHKLLEHGAYKLSAGHFEDSKNNEKTPIKHSIENLLAQCDDEEYNLLKKNLKEHSEWNDELEAKFPDR